MQVDESFIKGLKNAVRPEYLITDAIWDEWHNALLSTDFYEQSILEFARSKQMFWPPTMHKETFGYFLNMEFASVKNILGNDSKKTLIFCLADKMKTLNVVVNSDSIDENPVQHRKDIQSTDESYDSFVSVNCADDYGCDKSTYERAKELLNVLAENTKTNVEIISVLNNCIANIVTENDISTACYEKDEKQLAEQKRLFAELTKLSQEQLIDIDILRRENALIRAEFEMFKEEYLKLNSSVPTFS